jgi:hypothetical protein
MSKVRDFLLSVAMATTAAMPVMAQSTSAARLASSETHRAAIPDFSGVWSHPALPWFEPLPSGPRPVTNRSRKNSVSNYDELVGDYTNPILQPWAAEVVKKFGEISLAGVTYPNPANQCWPEPLPFIFKHNKMQMLQQPDKITMLYLEDHEVRWVRMNEPHPTHMTPSWHGDSVGHYEGDTLLIDTVGIRRDRPFAMIDLFGTPYTERLHVIERYQLLDYAAAKEGLERSAKENMRFGNIDGAGKYLQLYLTVEDEGVFTTPWSVTITYGLASGELDEVVCAENRHEYYYNKDSDVPTDEKPDF